MKNQDIDINSVEEIVIVVPEIKANQKADCISNELPFQIEQCLPSAVSGHGNLQNNDCQYNS